MASSPHKSVICQSCPFVTPALNTLDQKVSTKSENIGKYQCFLYGVIMDKKVKNQILLILLLFNYIHMYPIVIRILI